MEAPAERQKLVDFFAGICEERGLGVVEEVQCNANQKAMQDVVCSIQAIVSACPRGMHQGSTKDWCVEAFDALRKLLH